MCNYYRSKLVTEALALYESNLSCRKVAFELRRRHGSGPSHEAVREWVSKFSRLRSPSRAMEVRMATENERDYDSLRIEVRRLAEEELWSVRRIATHLGVNRKMVARAMDPEHRLDPREATLRRKWQAFLPDVELRLAKRDEVIRRRRQGEKRPAIAAATGLSIPTIDAYLRAAGLTRPQAKRTQNAR